MGKTEPSPRHYLIQSMTKPTKWPMHPMKTRFFLGICPAWSKSSLPTWRILGSLATQSTQRPLIRLGECPGWSESFAGRTCLVLPCSGSFDIFCCAPVRSEMSRSMSKRTKLHVRPAKTQISLGICPVWSVFAVHMKKPWLLSFPLSHHKDWSDCVNAQAESLLGAQKNLLVLSCSGSNIIPAWTLQNLQKHMCTQQQFKSDFACHSMGSKGPKAWVFYF